MARDVLAAAGGDRDAWVRLHDRFADLIWNIARAYHLEASNAADVCQTTWLRLAEHLDRIREPAHVRWWLATTARREALRALQRSRHTVSLDGSFDQFADHGQARADERLLADEECGAVLQAFQALPSACQTLLRVLMAEPVPSYAEVSAALDMPVGSIGPRRARCLERLRRASNLDGRPAA